MTEPRIVVDEVIRWPTKIQCFKAGSCHLMIEPDEHGQLDLERLHAFAASIGLRRSWFQPGTSPGGNPTRALPHYDLTPSKRELALKMGAVFVPWREQAEVRRKMRKQVAPVRAVPVDVAALRERVRQLQSRNTAALDRLRRYPGDYTQPIATECDDVARELAAAEAELAAREGGQ